MAEIKYLTWGSYGQFARSLAVLRSGAVVDPTSYLRMQAGHLEDKIEDIKIDVVVTRSRRNVEIKINVPDQHVLAVVKESASSSGWKGFTIEHGVGRITSETEKEENVRDNKKFVDTYQVYYYVHENIKVKLKKVKVKTDVQTLGKQTVYFSCKGGTTTVWGDTFEIREHLKALGFKWNSSRKVWFIDAERSDVATKLSEFADVRRVD